MLKRSASHSTATTTPSDSTTQSLGDTPQDTHCKSCMKDKEWNDGKGNYRCWDCPYNTDFWREVGRAWV